MHTLSSPLLANPMWHTYVHTSIYIGERHAHARFNVFKYTYVYLCHRNKYISLVFDRWGVVMGTCFFDPLRPRRPFYSFSMAFVCRLHRRSLSSHGTRTSNHRERDQDDNQSFALNLRTPCTVDTQGERTTTTRWRRSTNVPQTVNRLNPFLERRVIFWTQTERVKQKKKKL